jgi:hypothetical protein
MVALIEIVISLVNLLEAEMRQFKAKSRDLFLSLGLILVAVALACAGFWLLLGAVFYWLCAAGLSIGMAAFLCACLALVLAGIVALLSRKVSSR